MSTFKLICALALVLVSSAIAVATASAAETLWRFLPGSAKETFTGKSGSVLFEYAGDKLACTGSTILLVSGGFSSELIENGATLALALIRFTGCQAEHLSVNSEGDEKEVILAHLEIHDCLIKKGDLGLLLKILPVRVLVLILDSIVELSGAFIALILPLEAKDKKHFELNIKQTGGIQEIEKCEGGERQTLKAKFNTEPAQNVGVGFSAPLLLFDGTKDKEGEELMEN
jgi:hypothetical protein